MADTVVINVDGKQIEIPEFVKGAGEILYINNSTPITRQNEQEQYKKRGNQTSQERTIQNKTKKSRANRERARQQENTKTNQTNKVK